MNHRNKALFDTAILMATLLANPEKITAATLPPPTPVSIVSLSAIQTRTSLLGTFSVSKVFPDECLDDSQNIVLPTATSGPSWVFTINFWNQNPVNSSQKRVGCFVAYNDNVVGLKTAEYHLVTCNLKGNVSVTKTSTSANFTGGSIDCPFLVSDYFNLKNSNFYFFSASCTCKYYWLDLKANLQNNKPQQVFTHPTVNFNINKTASATSLVTTFNVGSMTAFTSLLSAISGVTKYRSELKENTTIPARFDVIHSLAAAKVKAGLYGLLTFNNSVSSATIGPMTGSVSHFAVDPCGNW